MSGWMEYRCSKGNCIPCIIAPFTCVCIDTYCALSKEIRVPPVDDSIQYRANVLHPRCSTSQPWVTSVFSFRSKSYCTFSTIFCSYLHGNSSLLPVMMMMVWHFVNDSDKVMTGLIILFYLQHAVEISLQSHTYIYTYLQSASIADEVSGGVMAASHGHSWWSDGLILCELLSQGLWVTMAFILVMFVLVLLELTLWLPLKCYCGLICAISYILFWFCWNRCNGFLQSVTVEFAIS